MSAAGTSSEPVGILSDDHASPMLGRCFDRPFLCLGEPRATVAVIGAEASSWNSPTTVQPSRSAIWRQSSSCVGIEPCLSSVFLAA